MVRRFFCLLLAGTVFLAPAARAEADAAPVRLHVIAESDSDADQARKLMVRDACLACARDLLKDCTRADEAYFIVRKNLDRFEEVARSAAGDVEIACEAGVFTFPDRLYGDWFVPAGEYRALRVVIGAGAGRNWWCVLYPSLCWPEDREAGDEIHFYSAIWDWITDRWFGGNAA